jgi:hypothetical protein
MGGTTSARSHHYDADAALYSLSRHSLPKTLVLLKGTASAVPKQPGQRPYRSAEGPERSPKGEATDLLPLLLPLFFAFVFAVAFIFPRFPPKNRMSSPKTT